MPNFHNTWSFTGPGGVVWHEVYDSIASDLDAATPSSNSLEIKARAHLLNGLCVFNTVTVKSIDDPSVPPVQVGINLSGSVADPPLNPANAKEAAVYRLLCSDGTSIASRKLWLRGLNERDVSRDEVTGKDVVNAEFAAAVSLFLIKMQGLPAPTSVQPRKYGMIPRTRATWEGPLKRFKIIGLTGVPGDDQAVIETDAAHGLAKGQRIVINATDAKTAPGLKGIFTVIAFDATHLTVRYSTPAADIHPGGYLYRLIRPTLLPIQAVSCRFAFLGSRDTKKLDTNSRGRRPAKRLRLLA